MSRDAENGETPTSTRILWLLALSSSLIPSLQEGVDPLEVVSLVGSLGALGLIVHLRGRKRQLPPIALLWVVYLPLSLLSLEHETLQYFLTLSAGALTFSYACFAGAQAASHLRTLMPVWLLLYLLVASLRDLALDYYGISLRDSEQPLPEWELGVRGRNSAVSTSGYYLTTVALAVLSLSKRRMYQLLAAGGLGVGFYHVVVIGQGRGTTALAGLGALLLWFRGAKARFTLLILALPFFAAAQQGLLSELVDPLVRRFTDESFEEVDRLEHAAVALRLIGNMTGEQLVFGMWHAEIMVANDGTSIHNAFLSIFLGYGIIAFTVFFWFFVLLGITAVRSLFRQPRDDVEVFAAVMVVQMLLGLMASGIFEDWRLCIIPGMASGLVLSRPATSA